MRTLFFYSLLIVAVGCGSDQKIPVPRELPEDMPFEIGTVVFVPSGDSAVTVDWQEAKEHFQLSAEWEGFRSRTTAVVPSECPRWSLMLGVYSPKEQRFIVPPEEVPGIEGDAAFWLPPNSIRTLKEIFIEVWGSALLAVYPEVNSLF